MSTQRWMLTGFLILVLLAPGASQSLAQPAASQTAATPSTSGGSLLVVENAGQWPDAAHFQVWNSPLGPGTTWLAEDAIWLVVSRQVDWEPSRRDKDQVDKEERAHCDDPLVSLSTCLPVYSSHALKLTFPGGNPDVRIEPFGPVDTTVSYFIGDDPAQWRPAAPVWSGVRYVDLYPGVDLVLGAAGRFWRLEAQPGAATDQVQLAVEGAAVAGLADGVLSLTMDGELLSLALPQAAFTYQVSGASHQGEPLTLAAPPAVHARQQATPEDNPQDLIYRVMLRGSRDEYGLAVAVDAQGSAYVAGCTYSSNFPTTPGAFDPSYNGDCDAFVAKLNPTGSQLVYATFLGGRGFDAGTGIALDAAGSAYLTGYTRSSNFPTTPGAFETGFHGNYDAFAVKLSPDGSGLAYGTFLGGSNDDTGEGIAVDAAGSAYVAGSTLSADFPSTPGAFDPSYNFGVDDGDAFVLKLDASGSSLVYATFLGGGKTDRGYAIALDQVGSAYVTGFTYSSNFPATPDSFDPTYNYSGDAYVLKLNPAGSGLVYAGFLGGGWYDVGSGIAVDAAGSAHVTGYSACGDFPTTPGAFDRVCSGYYDAYAVKLDPTGSRLAYATLLGGSELEYGQAIAVSATGSAYVTGTTTSTDFPTTPYAYDTSYNGGYYDAFVAKLSAAGSGLAYATYFGAGNYDYGQAVAADGAGSATIAGTCDRDTACVVRLAARGALTTAQWTAAPPSVDGSFDDWAPATPLLLDRDSAFYVATQPASSPPPDPADNSAELRALWTATDLYFAISVRDDRIIADSPRVWNDDEIELAFVGALDFDPAGGDTHLYTVNADGRTTDLYVPDPPVEAAAVPVAGGWNVELRIPASHLLGSTTPPFSGKTLAFDLGLHDDDYGDVWDSFMIWAGDSLATPHAGGQLRLEGGPPPTPTPTNTPGATPTPTMTPTATATPTATPLPQPDLSTSSKAAWPAAAFHGQTILYYIDLRNTGRGTAQVTLLDAPPLPVIPNTAWGGLIWDAGAGTFRWHGYLVANDARSMGYSVSGPGICVPPGTVYTNTLRIYDGVQLAFTRSAQVVVDPGATPWAPCTPTVTPTPTATPTATATPTPTATPIVQFRYLPLLLRQES